MEIRDMKIYVPKGENIRIMIPGYTIDIFGNKTIRISTTLSSCVYRIDDVSTLDLRLTKEVIHA